MADGTLKYPYVMGTDKFIGFLKKIPDIGLPQRFQHKNLKSLGYTSSNDERIIPVMRFIRFLDSSGAPTDLWKEARGNLSSAIGKGVRLGYSDLFDQYANAHQKDDEALRTFFTVHSGTGKEAVSKMVATFKALSSLGNFDSVSAADQRHHEAAKPGKDQATPPAHSVNAHTVVSEGLPVSINIQLQLPADPTGEIYEKFFAAMAKHLPVKR